MQHLPRSCICCHMQHFTGPYLSFCHVQHSVSLYLSFCHMQHITGPYLSSCHMHFAGQYLSFCMCGHAASRRLLRVLQRNVSQAWTEVLHVQPCNNLHAPACVAAQHLTGFRFSLCVIGNAMSGTLPHATPSNTWQASTPVLHVQPYNDSHAPACATVQRLAGFCFSFCVCGHAPSRSCMCCHATSCHFCWLGKRWAQSLERASLDLVARIS